MAAVLFPFVFVMFAVFTRNNAPKKWNNALRMLYFCSNKKKRGRRMFYCILS
ncbi:hypothetical protein SAMN02745171_00792 [Porphyromonas circumdentaria]|uniref:Uncharacterized protein n=1 Tax=Porphyromonas circumdentaria TaxID=29524 RepID=A0A1T4MIQ8_9PORP|nr:hypothetical protein [Porphyromonas circumdentaria]SJZ66735.1 hypothetical protein SAMN02745171_00792 [Porphyromonas circumdentaria]